MEILRIILDEMPVGKNEYHAGDALVVNRKAFSKAVYDNVDCKIMLKKTCKDEDGNEKEEFENISNCYKRRITTTTASIVKKRVYFI